MPVGERQAGWCYGEQQRVNAMFLIEMLPLLLQHCSCIVWSRWLGVLAVASLVCWVP
jgi:hypothetical protein